MSMMQARLAQRADPRSYSQAPDGEGIPIPAPTLGMNTRDGVAALDPREARLIRNMIVENGRLVGRSGKVSHQTITGATSVGSLFTHEGKSANVLLAFADGKIFDATGTPSQLATGYSLNTWSIAQFNATTLGVNGMDTPWAFNGSAIGASGLSGSGLTITNLRTVHQVGIRLWFTENNSADVWYLAEKAITGVLTKQNLSLETKGGYCVGIYPFKSYTLFIMSTGEFVAYQGDVAIDFAKVGTYTAPKPVGYDPAIEVQGDLIIMTTSGAMPFEAIAAGVSFDSTSLASWGKIAPTWTTDFISFGSIAGWNTAYFMGLILFNIQTDTGTSKQWIYNTRTKGWSFFGELDGYQFAELNGALYLSDKATNTIWKYQGGTDNGAIIVSTVRHAFNYPFQNKINAQFTAARLNVQATGNVTGQVQVDVDYLENGITAAEFPLASGGSGPWDGPWDGPWGEDGAPLKLWSSVKGFGRAVAPVAQFNSQADNLQYFATDVLVAPAGVIG